MAYIIGGKFVQGVCQDGFSVLIFSWEMHIWGGIIELL